MLEDGTIIKRAVIVSNGTIRDEGFSREVIKKGSFIIAADGGSRHLINLNIIPDLIIGDLDSLDQQEISRISNEKTGILSYPCDKDKSDTQLALEYALDRGAAKIVILGGFGDRIDHTLANLHLLIKGVERGVDVRLLDEKNEAFVINKSAEIEGVPGTVLSLLPLSSRVKGIFTKGLKYPLKEGVMEIGNPYGISNEIVKTPVKIEIASGYLLIIIVRE